MVTKAVVERVRSNRAVVAALRTHVVGESSKVKALLKPFLKRGETLPDVDLMAELVARLLEARCETMETAEQAHIAEQSDDAEPRERRTEAETEVFELMKDMRAEIGGVIGAKALALVGVGEAVPQDVHMLLSYANNALDLLKNEAIVLPPPKRPQSRFDRASYVAELNAAIPKLSTALADVAREERELEGTQKNKNEALAAHDRDFAFGAQLGSALLRGCGAVELAERIRPSRRRPGTTEEEPEPTPSPEKSPNKPK